MRAPILYSFVKYRPYIETGEFVNVGLLMCEPNTQKITYRLVAKDDQRVNQFTPEEMARFYHHFTDVKEGRVQYDTVAVGLVDEPQKFFNNLYKRYISVN